MRKETTIEAEHTDKGVPLDLHPWQQVFISDSALEELSTHSVLPEVVECLAVKKFSRFIDGGVEQKIVRFACPIETLHLVTR